MTSNNKILWGTCFITAAAILVLHIFGLLGEMNAWTILISVPIVAGIVGCIFKMDFGMIIWLLAALVFIYRRSIESTLNISINFWMLLGIAALMSIGIHILFGKRFAWDSIHDTTENVTGEKLYFEEQFSGAAKYIRSENLSYVSIRNRFGGMEIYFENATISPEGCVVDVENAFGGIEIYVPRGWNIVDSINNFAGGIDCPKFTHTEGAPTITFRGSNKFGGIDFSFV